MRLNRIDLVCPVVVPQLGNSRRDVIEMREGLQLEFVPEEEVVEIRDADGKALQLIPRDNVASMTPG